VDLLVALGGEAEQPPGVDVVGVGFERFDEQGKSLLLISSFE